MSDIETWYKTLVPFTKYYLSSAVLCTIAIELGLFSYFTIAYLPALVVHHLHAWRLVTTFLFFGSLNISFIFAMVILCKFC
jgi:Derlin-2/3